MEVDLSIKNGLKRKDIKTNFLFFLVRLNASSQTVREQWLRKVD